MFEKLEKMQIFSLGILLALGMIGATTVISSGISKNEISVTGSAYQVIKSDSGTLDFSISVTRPTKKEAYEVAQSQIKLVEKYLKDNNITKYEIKTVNGYYNYKRDYRTGGYTNEIASYSLFQPFTISSEDVELIKKISNDITGLINQGADIVVERPSYDYSKLPKLKVALLEEASKDAQKRATAMLKPTHNRVGKVKSVRMGVFQITPVDSTNVSDMGINDTSTIDKKVTAVANVSFGVK